MRVYYVGVKAIKNRGGNRPLAPRPRKAGVPSSPLVSAPPRARSPFYFT